ncbi:hypothetical protein ACI78V_11215 [Geodermatophilus sp. SYSU D00742]
MDSLAYLFGALGAVLILVAVVGGDFEFLGWRVPRVGRVARGVASLLGGLSLLTSLVLFVMEQEAARQHPPSARPSSPEPSPTVPTTETPTTTVPATTAPTLPPTTVPTTTVPPAPAPIQSTPAVQYAVGYVGAGGYTSAYLFREPSTTSTVIGTLPQGTLVYILCTVRGEPVPDTSAAYSSDLWNYTSHGGYVADIAVYTGTDDATMPAC